MTGIDGRAQPIFFEALELGTDDWCAFLEKVCGSDTDLRSRVDQLLQAHQALGKIRGGGSITPTENYIPAETPGTIIGPYKILEPIGEGGMGAVYLAQQTEPVKRLVALKVIKAGMDSKQVLARFEAERQALALMDHPNIARVLDAGTVGTRNAELGTRSEDEDLSFAPGSALRAPRSEGRPYFVMELVKGVPITKFCDERKLTPRERLELFLPVCYAIQHAHQKGIIHRDIKPTNVLVTFLDGKPVPKVIDFGVAKAAGQPLTERTLVTGLGAVVGTPEYMSPEQAELNQLDIDTRSDVYSLGILLYELLTGTTPLTHKRVKGTALLEVLRVIREEEPQKPSTRLSTADELPAIAANRSTEPARLSRQLRGEIDWIVMTALDKERGRRYETANGLAADVRRYLAGEAVQAVPPSVAYRFRKFARRNKPELISAVLLGAMLLVLVGSLGWVVSDRAARRARTALEVTQFLERGEALYVDNKLPEAVAEIQKARGVLATTGSGDEELHRLVQQRLTDLETARKMEENRMEFKEPAARDRVYANFARAFREYGIDVEALSTEDAAARIAASHIKLDLALALDQWALCLQYDPRPLDRARWEKLFAISQAADPDPWRQRCNEAYEARNSQALLEIAEGADLSRLRTRALAALGDSLRDVGEVKASVAFLRKVQALHPDDYSVNASLAWSLKSLNPTPWDEVVAFRRVAVALRPDSYVAHFHLGYSLQIQGKVDEAIACYTKVIELEPDHAEAHFNLGIARRDQGKPAESLASFQKASVLLPNDPNPQNGLAWELATSIEPGLRDPARAVRLAKKAVELSLKQDDDRARLGNYWNTLGVAHYRAGEFEEAVAALEKSMDLRKGGDCKDWFFLGMAHWKLGKEDEARKWYERGAEWMVKEASKDEELRRFRTEAAGLLGIEAKK